MMTLFDRFDINYFFSIPPETQIIWFWLSCFALLLLFTVSVYIYLRSRGVKAKPYRSFSKSFFWPNFAFSIMGLVLTFSRYEKLPLLSYRFWIYITILGVITFNAWFFIVKRSQLEDELLKFYNIERKSKWLSKTKSKK